MALRQALGGGSANQTPKDDLKMLMVAAKSAGLLMPALRVFRGEQVCVRVDVCVWGGGPLV